MKFLASQGDVLVRNKWRRKVKGALADLGSLSGKWLLKCLLSCLNKIKVFYSTGIYTGTVLFEIRMKHSTVIAGYLVGINSIVTRYTSL